MASRLPSKRGSVSGHGKPTVEEVNAAMVAKQFRIVPVEGESHEGRQWGYEIHDEYDHVVATCSTGGTGACWNIDFYPEEQEAESVHVCELDDLIDMLVTLRDSKAHADHVARWE